MKTLSDFKRALTVGSSITLIDAPDMPDHRFLGLPRFVVKAQTSGVYLSTDKDAVTGSFLDFPAASLVEFDGDTVKIFHKTAHSLALVYRLA